MDTGNIEKLNLVGYADNSFSKKTGNSYTALINPEQFSISYATSHTPRSGHGASEEQRTFHRRSPQTVTLKIIVDGTGIISSGTSGGEIGAIISNLSGGKKDVAQEISSIKQVLYGYDSDTHMPTFVQLRWGKIIFNAQLTSMTISFKLFKPDGTPIRAEVDCSFQGVIDDKKLAALENKQSPDLTHLRTIVKGDSLSLICYEEYGDSKYYYQVARVNRLADFKQLIPGTRLILPPITNQTTNNAAQPNASGNTKH